MIERPLISDETIIAALHEHYSIPVVGVEFLPIGNDASAWAYRVDTEDQNSYFLKVKKAVSNQAGFFVPRFLRGHGIAQVLAPLLTKAQNLWVRVVPFFLILYPFVNGSVAMDVGMSDSQWMEFGSVLKRIHTTELPLEISQFVRRESFRPKWGSTVKELHEQINTRNYDDPYQGQFAHSWKENNEIIQAVLERTERIGKWLSQTNLKFVLCHADIHTANILITQEGNMVIVDWDDTLFAPQEPDLMFVLNGETARTREEQMFFHGYGEVEINPLALAYYRYEWCVQEIGDFGNRIFWMKDLGERTRENAVEGFMQLFSEGDVIQAAFETSLQTEIRKLS